MFSRWTIIFNWIYFTIKNTIYFILSNCFYNILKLRSNNRTFTRLFVLNVTCILRTALRLRMRSLNWSASSRLLLTTFQIWRMKLIVRTKLWLTNITRLVWSKERSKSLQEYCRKEMLLSTNLILNSTLSIQSTKCRLKSLRTSVKTMKSLKNYLLTRSTKETF